MYEFAFFKNKCASQQQQKWQKQLQQQQRQEEKEYFFSSNYLWSLLFLDINLIWHTLKKTKNKQTNKHEMTWKSTQSSFEHLNIVSDY